MMRRVAVACVGLAVVAPAWACQAAPPAPGSPAEPTPAEMEGGQPVMARPPAEPVRPTPPATVSPADPGQSGLGSIPGLEETDFMVGRAPLRAEGTFLVRQAGSIVRLETGERVFVFHRDASGVAERPMVLMPCQTLARMERIADDRPDAVFLLTGQVFVYGNVNFALPTAFALASGAGAPEAPAREGEGAEASAGLGADPSVQELIRELEAQRPRLPTLERTALAGPEVAARAAEQVALVPDGEFLVRRRGRMVRLAGGEWAVAFDNDASSEADAPMVLAPCQYLARMERMAARSGESRPFEISGRVLSYGGRNYLIPTLVRFATPSELGPLQ